MLKSNTTVRIVWLTVVLLGMLVLELIERPSYVTGTSVRHLLTTFVVICRPIQRSGATVYYDNFWHTYTSISFLWSVYSTFFILSETENFIKCLTVYITMAASGCHFEHLQYLCSPLSLHFHLITNKSALFRATNRLPVNSVRENVCNDTKQRKKSVFLIWKTFKKLKTYV